MALKVRSSPKYFLYQTHGSVKFIVLTNHIHEDPPSPLPTCPFIQDVQLSVLSVGLLKFVNDLTHHRLFPIMDISSPKASFQVCIGWEGIPPGVRICIKKMLAKYNRCCILQVDTWLEMAESSGKGYVFATALSDGMHE